MTEATRTERKNTLTRLLNSKISLSENVRSIYWGLTILFIAFSAFTALVMFVWTAPAGDYVSDWPGFGWFRPIENYYQISQEHVGWRIEKRLHHLVIWYLFVYLLSFLVGLIPRFERRPLKPVTMLHAGMGFFLGALMAGGAKYYAEESLGFDLIASMLAVVVLFIIPWLYVSGALFMEHVFVLCLAKISAPLHRHNFAHLADTLLMLALRFRPSDKNLHRILGLSLFSDDNYEEALKQLEPLFQENQDDVEILTALEKCYRKLEREAEALEVQKHLLELEPERENIRLHAVRILSHQGHHRQAVEMLDANPDSHSIEISALRLDEEILLNDHDGALSTANVIHGLDSGSEHYAIEAYKKILDKWPDSEHALEELAKLEKVR